MDSTDPMEYLHSLTVAVYPAGVMPGQLLLVRWGQDAADAGQNSRETTVTAVQMVTMATRSASDIQSTSPPLNLLPAI